MKTSHLLAALSLLAAPALLAQESSFTQDLSTDWFLSGNWDAGVPTSDVTAVISSGHTAIVNGGSASAYFIDLGTTSSIGTLQVTGVGSSITSTSGTYVGSYSNSQGFLTVSSGATGSSYALYMGWGTDATGTFTLESGSSWTTTSQFHVGSSGSGSVVITGVGTHLETTTDQNLDQNYNYIGNFGNGTMTVTDHATWHTVGYVGVGSNATGNFTVSGGGAVTTGDLFDVGGSGTGTVVVTGAGSSLSVGQLRLSTSTFGSGSLSVRDGASLASTGSILIYDTGTLTIGGVGMTAGSVVAPTISLEALTSSLIFNHSDDTAFTVPISSFDVGYGSLTKAGTGTLTLSNSQAFTGTTTISGGTLKLGTATALSGSAVNLAGGTLDLNGFTATLGGLSGSTNFDFGAGTLTIGGAVDSTYSGVLSGGALVKSGNGAFKLTGVNTYTGGTTISAGFVEFDSASNFGSGDVTLNGGGLRWATGNTLDITTNPKFVLTASTTAFDTSSNNVTLSGATTILTSLRKLGSGTLTLTSTSLYTGPTTVAGGTLALAGALPTGNLALNGGGVLATSGTITRTFGTGSSQVALTSSSGGGFAAYGGPLTISPGAVTWGSGSFLTGGTPGPLVLGSATADNVVTWTNNIALVNSARTITVNDNLASNADYAVIQGVISSSNTSGSLTKSGAGSLVLTAANTYTGATTISGGTLALSGSGAIPTSRLNLAGGVLARSGTFNRAFGTGASQFTISGNTGGGFAAYGGALTVTPGAATWGAGNFFASGTGALILGSPIADNVVTWTSNIALGSGARTITANDNPTTSADSAAISGVISGSGSITKNGPGTLVFSGANTYTGATTISAGTLKVNNTLASSGVTVASGGTLGGTGTMSGTVAINNGGKISPGNSPGTLNTGAETWAGGAGYVWEINKGDGTKGADPGYDWLNITGALNITATNISDATKFTITITSLTLGNAPGLATGFTSGQSYTFTIATASGGITGFNADKFLIDTSGFFNDSANFGGFTIVQSGNNLNLTYTAIPEPRAFATAIVFFLGALVLFRRRNRHAR